MTVIAEMQERFSAYGCGELPERDLRTFIRHALQQEPQLSTAFVSLVDAYRRANLIDVQLQSSIHADIVEVTGPMLVRTMIRTPTQRSNTDWLPDTPAANATDVHAMGGFTSPLSPEPTLMRNTTGSVAQHTSSTGGSAWDIMEGLAEVGTPLYPGSVIRDRFVLVEELGRGGMGVVYKAFDRHRGDMKDRYVAIKVLNEDFKRHPLAVRSLQREARKAQRLAHPNIVSVFDFDRDGGNVYMVMECLTGRSLDQVLREDGQGGIPLTPALDIIRNLAAALRYAHEQEIVHCDFKPSNTFLTSDGKVKVLDFGIARAAPSVLPNRDATLFDAGQLGAISAAYASFEMLQREEPSVRDDVYAFACVAYEILTGRHPYQRVDAVKAFDSKLEPRPVRKLSRSQWRALRQGLALRRADRCSSIDALVSELLVPRRRTNLLIGAAAGVAVAAIAAGVVWKWGDVRQVAEQYVHVGRHDQGVAPAAGGDRPAVGSTTGGGGSGQEAGGVIGDGAAAVGAPGADATSAPEPGAGATTAAGAGVPGKGATPTAGAAGLQGASATPTGVASAGAATTVAGAAGEVATTAAVGSPGGVATTAAVGAPGGVATTTSAAMGASGAVPTAAATAGASTAAAGNAGALSPETGEAGRARVEMLREQFETQAAGGDIPGAIKTSGVLSRAAPGSVYVTKEVPRVLELGYQHLAKSQFAAGQVNESMQTLEDGRRKLPRSVTLKDLQARYLMAADLYDRLSTAVVLNVSDTKQALEPLKAGEGDEYDVAAQMLAQTLADRIADQRAANRETVADKLLEAGKQIFPALVGILGRGRPGALQAAPIAVSTN